MAQIYVVFVDRLAAAKIRIANFQTLTSTYYRLTVCAGAKFSAILWYNHVDDQNLH